MFLGQGVSQLQVGLRGAWYDRCHTVMLIESLVDVISSLGAPLRPQHPCDDELKSFPRSLNAVLSS